MLQQQYPPITVPINLSNNKNAADSGYEYTMVYRLNEIKKGPFTAYDTSLF